MVIHMNDLDFRARLDHLAEEAGGPNGHRWLGDELRWDLIRLASRAGMTPESAEQQCLSRGRFSGHWYPDSGELDTPGALMLASLGFGDFSERLATLLGTIVGEYIDARARIASGRARSDDERRADLIERFARILSPGHPDVQKYAEREVQRFNGDLPAGQPLDKYLSVQIFLLEKKLPIQWVTANRSAFGSAVARAWKARNPGKELLKHSEPFWQAGTWGGATVIETDTNRYTESDRPLLEEVYLSWGRYGKLPT
jgi:hypothetical protein